MNNSQSVEFGAIITISLPEQAGEADYHVVLAPSDLIVGDENQMKPLGDCTLSELRRFADELEADVWSAYEAMSLFDIVVDGRATISVVRADDRDTEAPPKELTLQHLVIFPGNDEAVLEAVDAESGKIKALEEDIADALKTVDEPAETSEEVVSSRSSKKVQELESALDDLSDILDAKSEAKTQIGAENDQPAEEESATAVERGIETVEDEAGAPDVSVSQSELVHEEAEAAEIIKPVTPAAEYKKPLFRILGKRRPPNHPTWTAVDILMSERAFRAAQVHANSSLDREVAGVLLGPHPEKQPDGRYVVHVSDAIVAKHTRMQGASVTYTPESWRYVNDRLAELYPNDEAVIVGWYHTHPGFGIFLSGMDQFIHQNFFTQKWHIAMVLDPQARHSGFFCWDRQMSKVDKYEFPWPVWASSSW